MAKQSLSLKLVTAPRTLKARKPRTTTRKLTLGAVKAGGGAILGGFIPLAAHTMSHESNQTAITYSVVTACLAYSAPSLYSWISNALADDQGKPAVVKASGFVFCLEAILVASPVQWLSWTALALLAGLNAIILGARLGRK